MLNAILPKSRLYRQVPGSFDLVSSDGGREMLCTVISTNGNYSWVELTQPLPTGRKKVLVANRDLVDSADPRVQTTLTLLGFIGAPLSKPYMEELARRIDGL